MIWYQSQLWTSLKLASLHRTEIQFQTHITWGRESTQPAAPINPVLVQEFPVPDTEAEWTSF